MTKKELEARVAALEAQVALLLLDAHVMTRLVRTTPFQWYLPNPAPYTVTYGSGMTTNPGPPSASTCAPSRP